MNRIFRPGVCLLFLLTGMSAGLSAESRRSALEGRTAGLAATGTHLKFITAAILCHSACRGHGAASGLPSGGASRSGAAVFDSAECSLPTSFNPALGFAKRTHFGFLSARKV